MCPRCLSNRVGHWIMAFGIRYKCTSCGNEWSELNDLRPT
jgi:transposase-like protein